MSDTVTVIDRCLDQTTTPKEETMSEEVNLPPEIPQVTMLQMKLTLPDTVSFTGDASSVNQELIRRQIYLETGHGVRAVALYLFLEDAENPGVPHFCGFIGPHCVANCGIGYYCDDVIAAAGLQLFEVHNGAYILRTVNVTVAERSTQHTLADYNRFGKLVAKNGHTDLLQLSIDPETMVSTSPFVRIKCVGLCQVMVDSPTGNPVTSWHRVEAASEVFIYRPSRPSVEGIHPMEMPFCHGDQAGDTATASCNIIVKLNRKLITGNGYDQLKGAMLVLPDGTELPIDTVYVTQEQDRVNLNLRDCLSAVCDLPQAPDRFLAKVRLLGVTTGRGDWGAGTLSDVIIVQRLVAALQPPPGKEERRLKCLDPTLLEDNFYG